MDRSFDPQPPFEPVWHVGQRIQAVKLGEGGDWRVGGVPVPSLGPNPPMSFIADLRPAMLLEGDAGAPEWWADLEVFIAAAGDDQGFLPVESAELFSDVYLGFSGGRVSLEDLIRDPNCWPIEEGFVIRSSDDPTGAIALYRTAEGEVCEIWETELILEGNEKPWLHRLRDRVSVTLGSVGMLQYDYETVASELARLSGERGVANAVVVVLALFEDDELQRRYMTDCRMIPIRDESDWQFVQGAARRSGKLELTVAFAVDLAKVQVRYLHDTPRP